MLLLRMAQSEDRAHGQRDGRAVDINQPLLDLKQSNVKAREKMSQIKGQHIWRSLCVCVCVCMRECACVKPCEIQGEMLRFALICIFLVFPSCLPEVLKPSLLQTCKSVQHLVDVETDVWGFFFLFLFFPFISRSDSSALSKKPRV